MWVGNHDLRLGWKRADGRPELYWKSVMIETLCIAAEITVGILLISMAWERAALTSDEKPRVPSGQGEGDSAVDHRLVAELYQQCLLQASCLLPHHTATQSTAFSGYVTAMAKMGTRLVEGGDSHDCDPASGLGNHLVFEQWLERPAQASGSALFLDIRSFQAFNEAHGMENGDRMLSDLARDLHRRFAWGMQVLRIQNGRIACIAPGMTPEQLRKVISAEVLEYQWQQGEGEPHCIQLAAGIVTPAQLVDSRGWTAVINDGLMLAKLQESYPMAWMHEGVWTSEEEVGPALVAMPLSQEENGSSQPEEVPAAPAPPTEDSSNASTELNTAMENTAMEEKAAAKPVSVVEEPAAGEMPAEQVAPESGVKQDEAVVAKVAGEAETAQPEVSGEASPVLAPEEEHERASGDDIEQLFAQMKASLGKEERQVGGSKREVEAGSELNATGESVVESAKAENQEVESAMPLAAKLYASEEANRGISQDDIQDLLGNISSLGAEVTKATKGMGTSSIAKNNASQLDAGAKRAEAQGNEGDHRQIAEGATSSIAPAKSDGKSLTEIVTDENKTEKASQDDIAALFAAMRK